MRMRSTVSARIVRGVALLASVAASVTFVFAGTGRAEVPPVENYATYPAPLPDSCQVSGADILVGELFSVGSQSSGDLRNLAVQAGDTIVMTWDAFAAGCEGLGIGLSSKVATVATFDATRDYWLRGYAYCGPESGATPCVAPFRLELVVPPASEVPCYQIDAHVGAPLAVVGPSGDYYGGLNGSRNLLISALNGGAGDCTNPPPCPTNPSIPASALLCQSTVTTPTTAPPTTPPSVTSTAPQVTVPPSVTEPPSTTTPSSTSVPSTVTTAPPPVTSTSAPAVQACASNPALPASSPDCRPAVTVTVAQSQLPRTGSDARPLAQSGLLLLVAGACIAYAYGSARRTGRDQAPPSGPDGH